MSGISGLQGFQERFDGPLYMRLKLAFEAFIHARQLQQGDALPSERDISEICNVSRVTVRRAIDALVDEGALVRRHGSGTFVAAPRERIDQPLSCATSFSEDMARRGMVSSSRWLDRGLYLPSSDEMMSLGLTGNSKVARLKRLRLADGVPVALENASLPSDILPDPEKVDLSLYAHLASLKARPVRAVQRISARLLTSEEARLLAVPEGEAGLAVHRLAYLSSGRAIETTKTLYRSDLYDLVAEQIIAPA
ncbi:GntR family transcriptional regulator [Roseibium litorale]|uniref:GntR family transcriptional regulator n=1 Tax=Roseibium litorale TaxID=2803841 RepID=A0ABR9CK45_9HYPH|nr:GntR family transcriptional regulator [Roseibium litorale]MBD8891230.1 GntR family transcriptional regulator [Roseibium litorale]